MRDLLDLVNDDPLFPEHLEPVRLSGDPTMLLAFTRGVEQATTHYLDEMTYRGDVLCPGAGCPLCFLGKAPRVLRLLPVVNVAENVVQVLRISPLRGVGTLLDALVPHLRGEGLDKKVWLVRRVQAQFSVEARPLQEEVDRHLPVISGFLEAVKQGLSLCCAFPAYSPEELAEFPKVRAALDAVGGWSPSARDARSSGPHVVPEPHAPQVPQRPEAPAPVSDDGDAQAQG